jgi:hypothetical protein
LQGGSIYSFLSKRTPFTSLAMPAKALPNRKPLLAFLALTLLVILVERLITQLQQFATAPALPLAVTLDLVVGLPLLYYFLIVRKYRVSPFTLTAVFAACVAVAAVVLPTQQQQYLAWVQKSWVLAEPLLVLLLLWRARRIGQEYRLARAQQPDLALNLQTAFQRVTGNPLRPLVSEIMVFRYGLFFWLRPAETNSKPGFTMHRESAFSAILGTLLLVTVAEALAVHFLVVRWSYPAAMALLILSLYTLLFLVGHLAATVQRPILIEAGQLHLRVGLVWAFSIPLTAIASAERLRDPDRLPQDALNLAKPLVTPPNVLLTCHAPIMARGMYGLRKKPRALALYVDAPEELLRALALQAGPATA